MCDVSVQCDWSTVNSAVQCDMFNEHSGDPSLCMMRKKYLAQMINAMVILNLKMLVYITLMNLTWILDYQG